MPKLLPQIKKITLTKNFISISKAAKFLQVSPDTLRNWEREGKLLPARTHGGARRYSMAELVALKKEIHPVASRKKGLVSISIAAKALQVSTDTLRDWDKKGLIESSRSKGGARRFTRDEINRLRKELGREAVVIESRPKSRQEVHKFSVPWIKIIFPLSLMMLLSATGWFVSSYIGPLERKIEAISKLTAELVGSIESLQRGVLGIQSQPTPSPIVLPGNLNIHSANSDEGVNITYAEEPVILDSSSGKISCPSCLSGPLTYISSFVNSDGALGISVENNEAKVSLNLDHANNWSATQSFKGGIQINDSTANPVVMTSSGNVGIGWTSPINKLEVAGGQTIGAGYAGKYSAPANGLLVQGNVGIGISNGGTNYALDVNGGARFGCGNTTWDSGPATSCADIAEVYESDGSADVGEIVISGAQPNVISRSTMPYQKGIIGVYSTSPGLLIGGQTILGGNSNLGNNKIPVALAGRVPVKVSDENGPIEAGDYLTSSSIPGVAMKATRPGLVLGQALEAFAAFSLNESSSEDSHLVDIKLKFGRILTSVNVSFADPRNFFASLHVDNEGNLIIPRIKTASLILDPVLATASDQLAANDNQLVLNADPNYTSPGPNLASNDTSFIDLSGAIVSLEERIKNQEERIKVLEAQINTGNVGIGTTNIVRTSTPVAVPSEASSSASSSAVLTANNSQRHESTDTPTHSSTDSLIHQSTDTSDLTPPDFLLASSSAILAPVSAKESLSSDKLFADEDLKISGNLNVFGKTILASTTIAGDLSVDGTLSINGNSINVIGSPDCSEDKGTCGILYLQNSLLAYEVNFFNGLVTIDKTGNLRTQTVTVAEFRVMANKISGIGKIVAGDKSVDIENPLVKSNSRILITPTSETNLVLAVTEKAEGKKFTVSVAQPGIKDIVFDWFLINESD